MDNQVAAIRNEIADLSLRQDAIELKADKIDEMRSELLQRMEANQETLLAKFAALIPRSKNGPY